MRWMSITTSHGTLQIRSNQVQRRHRWENGMFVLPSGLRAAGGETSSDNYAPSADQYTRRSRRWPWWRYHQHNYTRRRYHRWPWRPRRTCSEGQNGTAGRLFCMNESIYHINRYDFHATNHVHCSRKKKIIELRGYSRNKEKLFTSHSTMGMGMREICFPTMFVSCSRSEFFLD